MVREAFSKLTLYSECLASMTLALCRMPVILCILGGVPASESKPESGVRRRGDFYTTRNELLQLLDSKEIEEANQGLRARFRNFALVDVRSLPDVEANFQISQEIWMPNILRNA